MATITFYSGPNNANALSGSGIGLYGSSGFGYSVAVGSYNGRTFITDSTGTNQGPEGNNCQFQNASGVIVGQTGSGILLLKLPNFQSTVNIRLTNASAIQVQNVQLYGYDRSNINNAPSGVTFYGASIVHPNVVQDLSGSGSPTWTQLSGSGSILNLVSSPGTSGLSPNGANTLDSTHDWYVALTATPNTVGAKLFATQLSLEYL
jgi:hypothetical protein